MKTLNAPWSLVGAIALIIWCAHAVPAAENLDRGVIALAATNGQVYVGWRLLAADPPDVAFDVLRSAKAAGPWQKLSPAPVSNACNFVDTTAAGQSWYYVVRPVSPAAKIPEAPPVKSATDGFLRIKLKGNYVCSKLALADLNGDGKLDYVIKQPNQTTDPGVWRKSVDTFKVEAYLNDGTFLWRKDLGWNIEQGIWYSPMVACDFDGDGKAEIALKTAPLMPDYRNETGRVLDGPEYCSVLDGMTGKEITRVDWPARGNLSDWGDNTGNRASRHLMGMARLDGKTPSLLVLRGTYTTMRVDAYNLADKKLKLLWSWNGNDENPQVRGQGMHGLHAVDVNDDGCDEILLGSALLDHTGKILWNTGLGHPDACYVTDIDPSRPGLEIIYGIEPSHSSNSICLVEARTGRLIWGCPHPAKHVHSQGLFGDIDPDNPGMEFYAGEKALPDRWMYSALTGRLLSREDLGSLSPNALFWDDTQIKAYAVNDKIVKYNGPQLAAFQGRIVGLADCLGDWREELITVVPGELRIYTTTIPATTRRICLLQDRLYRTDVTMQSMGYFYPPQPGGKLER
jgi:rhamnogalacturonan endolyase